MNNGYEITFNNFCELLSYPEHREAVAVLIRTWYGYEVIPNGDSFLLRDSDGREVSRQVVHDAIQANRDQQFHIYQTAMRFWR
jgi:hypothetical protein